jgi:hypothetical protein
MRTTHSRASKPVTATRDDVLHLFGEIDERKLLDILALHPTIAEIEEASQWAGNGDVLTNGGHPLSRTAADVVNILIADEEEEPPPAR